MAAEGELARQGVAAIITQVGCIGHCSAEPLLLIAKPGHPDLCYGYVTSGIVSPLVSDYLKGDEPRREAVIWVESGTDQ